MLHILLLIDVLYTFNAVSTVTVPIPTNSCHCLIKVSWSNEALSDYKTDAVFFSAKIKSSHYGAVCCVTNEVLT